MKASLGFGWLVHSQFQAEKSGWIIVASYKYLLRKWISELLDIKLLLSGTSLGNKAKVVSKLLRRNRQVNRFGQYVKQV